MIKKLTQAAPVLLSTYTTRQGGKTYYIDIIKAGRGKDATIEAWLYRPAYSVKMHILGFSAGHTEEELMRYITDGIAEYVEQYRWGVEDLEGGGWRG